MSNRATDPHHRQSQSRFRGFAGGHDSAEQHPWSLPVFTIASMNEFRTSNSYVEHVVVALYDYLLRIDEFAVRAALSPLTANQFGAMVPPRCSDGITDFWQGVAR